MKKNRLLLLLALVVGFASCEKDKDDQPAPAVSTGVYVLSEGLMNTTPSVLTYFDFNTGLPSTDFYQKTNSSGLGDTGNDMLIYGGKLYIVVHVSSVVHVADAHTGKAIKQIAFENGAKRLPRYIIPYKNKVFVSAYDGTVAVIDTTNLTIEKNITVGSHPEQMAVVGDKLYVANSGALNRDGPDSTISVVNLNTYTEIEKIKAGHLNPSPMVADDAGNLYVICYGDFSKKIPAKITKINTATNSIVKIVDTIAGKLAYYDGFLYATGGYGGSGNVRKLRLSDLSQESANFVTDGTAIQTPYGVDVDPENGDVWITDAKNYVSSGAVYCFDKTGKRKYMFTTDAGLNPNKVVFVK